MAKTGIHIKRANIGSVEAHNLRTSEYLAGLEKAGRSIYFFKDQTHLNQSWVNPIYEGKSCEQIHSELVELYIQKVKQKPQLQDRIRIDKKTGKEYTISGWSPIREGVIPIAETTTLDDFKKIKQWAENKGLSIIRIDVHHDEGYRNEETQETTHNRHAHIVFDWVDRNTGKTLKLDANDMSEFQDIVAESLQMERGVKKAISGKEHIDHVEYRNQKAEVHARELQKSIAKQMQTFLLLDETTKKNAETLKIGAELLKNLSEEKTIAEEQLTTIKQNISDLRGQYDSLEAEYQEKKKKLLNDGFGALGGIAKRLINSEDEHDKKARQQLEEIASKIKSDIETKAKQIAQEPTETKLNYIQSRLIESLQQSEVPEVQRAINITHSAFHWNINKQENIDHLIRGGSLYLPIGFRFPNGEKNDIKDLELQAAETMAGTWSVFAKVQEVWQSFQNFIKELKERASQQYRQSQLERVTKIIQERDDSLERSRKRSRGIRR